ncbi:uncharacterized protein LOC113410687 [Notechis scutatus]|uniref:Uncharacterized protein LOC113410687 n=1 Tax=Notechis scutatus TaxID=8663 RepID=A0A6J1TR63_9SAUR|nr:uncharacterized protein LOC113410687 [Notechis scutatus]
MDIMMDYYKVLDISQSASMNDIKRAYRSKVLRWHPDKNPENRKEAEQKFKEIVEAYKVLSDKGTRNHHDGSSKDTSKGTKKAEDEKHLSVFDQDGIKIFFTRQRSSSDFSVSFFSAPKRFHHFSIMTAIINGKKITTKRHLENESKYLEVEENGKTVSIHVNGIPVYDREFNGSVGSLASDCRLDKGRYRPNRRRFWTYERRQWADEWRQWASKWRDWAEECRDWAERNNKTKNQDNAGHHQANASEHPKASQEHLKSDKNCPRPGGNLHGFPMPGEGKCDSKEGHSKTNKGSPQSEEEHFKPDTGYFVFPKPGEKNPQVDEGHPKSSKRQPKPEEGNILRNVGIVKSGDGPANQDEGHHRTKYGKPRSEDGQARPGKMHLGLQKSDQESPSPKNSDPRGNVTPRKHISECNSQAETGEPHTEKQEPQSEGNKSHAVNLEKKDLKDEKLEVEVQKDGIPLESESEKRIKLNVQEIKYSLDPKQAREGQGSGSSATRLYLKRKELQIQTRKLYAKRNKSQVRTKISYSFRRNKTQAGKHRIPDGHNRRELEGKFYFNECIEMIPVGKMSPAGNKYLLTSRKKGPLPPLQKGETPSQAKKRLPRRRTYPSFEIQSEKLHSSSEAKPPLNTQGQQQRKMTKVPWVSGHLPSIQGRKFGTNQFPIMNR